MGGHYSSLKLHEMKNLEMKHIWPCHLGSFSHSLSSLNGAHALTKISNKPASGQLELIVLLFLIPLKCETVRAISKI